MSVSHDSAFLSVSDITEVTPLDVFEHETALSGLPDNLGAALFDGELNTYALIDAAKLEELSALIDAEQLEARCLFTGSAAEDYGDVAPWIVQLSGHERLLKLLFATKPEFTALWPRSAAVYLRSSGSLHEVWSHFRRLTKLPTPNGPERYFRFWDPEVAHFYFERVADWPDRVLSVFFSQHAVVDSLVAPLAEEETVRIFGLENRPKTASAIGAIRLEERDLKALSDLQWPKLERDLAAWLLRADKVRFRGFNAKRRKRLSDHAVSEGKAFGFTFKEEYAYFLYMMTFLGGWFHRAPQFAHFSRLLSKDPETRLFELKRNFPKVHAQRFGEMGKPSEVMPELLRRMDDALRSANGWDGLTAKQVESLIEEIERRLGWKQTEIAIVRADAQAQASEIGLKTPLAQGLHYLLWLLIGAHFLTDPLFPWAGELYATGETADDGIVRVAKYGRRRLARTLSLQRIMTDAKV